MTSRTCTDSLFLAGHGSFGVIRKVRRKADGMILCRKEISYLKMSQKEREQLHAEFQILSTLRHPNIVGYYHRDHLKASQDLHFYMEYCGNGDLGRVIRDLASKNKWAEESFVWSIFAQLVTALYRCHYGQDPPEVGRSVLGLGTTAKPLTAKGGVTILHRDLKPENVFLGADNSVKLGDFGLSKMIQSHDFASTYVGTPFYMSPEICAAEKYTLKSDVWSLGCIIYELCTREPPFNAKSHFQLVQKIKEGKFAAIPKMYSDELSAIVSECLRVNPNSRPDTATLLNLPAVRLMRKEREVVEFSNVLKAKEEALGRERRDMDKFRQETEATVRREWELKARLEIDSLVRREIDRLQLRFESEVKARVDVEVASAVATALQSQQQEHQQQLLAQKKMITFPTDGRTVSSSSSTELSSSLCKSDYPRSSVGAGSIDTDLTDLSLNDDLTDCDSSATAVRSRTGSGQQMLKKSVRTPFSRAQTFQTMLGTPGDVEMASPSPAVITSLALSPRRQGGGVVRAPTFNPTSNIFVPTDAEGGNQASHGHDEEEEELEEDGLVNDQADDDRDGDDADYDDDMMPVPSPTRMVKANAKTKNPFTWRQRPQLPHAPRSAAAAMPNPPLRLQSKLGSKPKSTATSPKRRLSKIPSAATLQSGTHSTGSSGGETGAATLSRKPSGGAAAANIKGRTLVELQQARAGGRPILNAPPSENNNSAASPKHQRAQARGRAAAFLEPAAVWDPEKDDMPSPFLVRRKPMATFGRG